MEGTATQAGPVVRQFVRVGTVGLRDPVTGEFEKSIPLYVPAEEDDPRLYEGPDLGNVMKTLADKFKAYKQENERLKREREEKRKAALREAKARKREEEADRAREAMINLMKAE